jgi:hypothetical protein
MAPKPEVRRSPVGALLYGAPIGLLGGLIGLGGATKERATREDGGAWPCSRKPT